MDYLPRSVELRRDPRSLLEGVQSILMVGMNYSQPNDHHHGRPRIARYALGRDYHKTLRSKLRQVSARLTELVPGCQTRICVDSAPLMEREFAQKAGLGWIGKNTCLINSHRGSWFLLGALLTDIELVSDQPAVGGCGNCQKCIEACPTGAIVQREGRWQVDSRKCISYLTIEHKGAIAPELSRQIGDWTFGCDICQDVCPFNEERTSQPLRALRTSEPDFLRQRRWPELEQLTVLNEAEWDALTQGSAVRRTGFEGLKRNAQINVINGKCQATEPSALDKA